MDDYKRSLLMRVRESLLALKPFHDSICYEFKNELKVDGAMLSSVSVKSIDELLPEMQELFDEKQWHKPEDPPTPNRWPQLWTAPDSVFNDGNDYWWTLSWIEPRIAMIDFLLNNR